MTRTVYIYDQELRKLVVKPQDTSANNSPRVMGDIEPYQTVGGGEPGKVITSRSKHREYLRRHNLIEVGNERKYFEPKG